LKPASPASSKAPSKPAARRWAHRALVAYDRARGEPLRGPLDGPGAPESPAERALARDLALGVAQRLNTLDWALTPLVSRPFAALDAPVRAALRLGAYQLLFAADRFPAYAALNETVSLVPPKARGIVNGVLRALQRQGGLPPWPADAVERLALEHSHPVWLVRRWTERWGLEAAASVLAAGNAAPPMTLRINRRKTSPADVAARLSSRGLAAAPTALSPDGVRVEGSFSLTEDEGFKRGDFSVQDEAAQLAVHLLDPRPGERVLDLCAGLGGKACHIAERLDGRGRVTAVDTDAPRLKRLKESVARLGLSCIEAVQADARDPKLAVADRVLVDVPCSGFGAVRRRPDIKWARDEEDVAVRLPALQRELLFAAADRVKPGGRLVYATCTTEPEENEGPVRALLEARPGFKAASAPGAGGDGFVRLRPDVHGTDGFFIAVMERKS
jgi:16S rRNA (cytosine967-C5)-methyltransferase